MNAEPDRPVVNSAEQTNATRWVVTSLSISTLLSSLGTSNANVCLPTLAQVFDASFQKVQWVVLAYLLAITCSIVSVGRLGDIIGHRRLLLAGIALFTLASAICGFTPTLWLLIAARLVQGLAAAVMMVLTMAFVSESLPKARTGRAFGLLGTMSAIGTALGPSLGGFLISTLGWRAVFLVNMPLGLSALALAYHHLPMDRRVAKPERSSFDLLGTLYLSLTLAFYALAMTLGRGRFGFINAMLLLAAAIGCALFLATEAKATSPLIRLELFRNAKLRASLAMNAIVSTVMMTTLVVGPFYLSRTLGIDAARLGLFLAVGPLIAALTGVPAGRLADRFGTQRATIVGLAGMVAGSLALSIVRASHGIAGYILPISLMTSGYALFQTANNASAMTDASPDKRGVISGMLNLSRNLGLVTGASLMGAVFSFATATSEISTARPEAVAAGMKFTFSVAACLVLAALWVAVFKRAIEARPAGEKNLQEPPLIGSSIGRSG